LSVHIVQRLIQYGETKETRQALQQHLVSLFFPTDGLTAATLQLNSAHQDTEVSEGQRVTLTCTSSGGQPVASVTTLRSGVTGQVLHSGTDQSQYTLDKAECDNAGSYTCVAGNGMGPDVHDTQQLRVKCELKFAYRMRHNYFCL